MEAIRTTVDAERLATVIDLPESVAMTEQQVYAQMESLPEIVWVIPCFCYY